MTTKKLRIYIVFFETGEEWPTWATSKKDAIDRAKDAIPSLKPIKAVLDKSIKP